MFNNLNDSQKRYLANVFPHIPVIIEVLEGIFKTTKVTNAKQISEICSEKLDMDKTLFQYGYNLLISEKIITGIVSKRKLGTMKESEIKQAEYELGEIPASIKNGKYFDAVVSVCSESNADHNIDISSITIQDGIMQVKCNCGKVGNVKLSYVRW